MSTPFEEPRYLPYSVIATDDGRPVVPVTDRRLIYRCKRCLPQVGWDAAKTYFTETDFIEHMNREHYGSGLLKSGGYQPHMACYRGIVNEGLACGAGYLICCCTLEPEDGQEMVCWRCWIYFRHVALMEKRICPVCRRQYPDYYPQSREIRPALDEMTVFQLEARYRFHKSTAEDHRQHSGNSAAGYYSELAERYRAELKRREAERNKGTVQ